MSPQPAKRIGPWLLDRALGQGGFGTVYAARHEAQPQVVRALKWVPAAGAAALERARREAEILAKVSHPGIVRIHDLGVENGGLYLVLDLVEGESLRGFVRKHPAGVPLEEACHLGGAMARAVGAAHRRGIAHRDLKPENVLLTPEGEIRVLDFGLALDAGADRLTRTGTSLGTLGYMAPEQLDGRRELQGPASDVYSLGAIFYELVTGQPIVPEGTQLERLKASAAGGFTLPSRLRPELPSEVDALVLRALAQEPRHRFPDGDAFAEALGALVRHEVSDARAAGASRSRLRAGLVLAIVLALVGVGAWLAVLRLHLPGATVDGFRARVEHELVDEPPTAARAAELARERAGFPRLFGAETRAKLEEVDRRLAVLALRADLGSSDPVTALAAARELARGETLPPAVLARVRDVFVRLEPDPALLWQEAAILCRGARDRGALDALAEVLVPRAVHEPAARHKALFATLAADLGESFGKAASHVAAVTRANVPAAEREDAIETLQLLGAAVGASRPERREVMARVAELILERAGDRRAGDPKGALEDRRRAFDLAPEVPSPTWYPGFLSRRAGVLAGVIVDANDEPRRAIQDELFAVLLEAHVEDAAWSWPLSQGMALGQEVRLRHENEPLGELVACAGAFMWVDCPYDSGNEGFEEVLRRWSDFAPRYLPLARSLARRVRTGKGRELVAESPDPSDPRETSAAAWSLLDQQPEDYERVRPLLERGVAVASERLATVEKDHLASPGDHDLERSWLLARARLAHLLDMAAITLGNSLLERRKLGRAVPPDELERGLASVQALSARALATCPPGFEYRALCFHSQLVDLLNAFGRHEEAVEAWHRAATDSVYVAATQDPTQDMSSVDKIISIAASGSLSGLQLEPPLVAEAEKGLELIKSLEVYGHPEGMRKYKTIEAEVVKALERARAKR